MLFIVTSTCVLLQCILQATMATSTLTPADLGRHSLKLEEIFSEHSQCFPSVSQFLADLFEDIRVV